MQLIDHGKVDGRKPFGSVVRGRDGGTVDNDRATGVIDATLNDTLLRMREAFGPAPRRIERGMVARLPSWATWEKAFKRYKSGQKHLLKHGAITWGALVQANNQLFEPGERDHPGNVVYDRREFSSPTALEATAQALAATKGSAQPDPAVDVIASSSQRKRSACSTCRSQRWSAAVTRSSRPFSSIASTCGAGPSTRVSSPCSSRRRCPSRWCSRFLTGPISSYGSFGFLKAPRRATRPRSLARGADSALLREPYRHRHLAKIHMVRPVVEEA